MVWETKMDTKQLQQVEQRLSDALSEYKGPINETELADAVQAFLAFDADCYIQAKGRNSDRRVVLWIHALSHVTGALWQYRQYEHLKSLYREAVKRSDAVGDYGCMDRLLGDFMTHSRWFDDPRDYGYGEAIPDYERLYAEREQRESSLKAVAERNPLRLALEQEIIKIRLRGFRGSSEMSDWRRLKSGWWQKREQGY